jgi:PPOX class probable F420-dependent enzyme
VPEPTPPRKAPVERRLVAGLGTGVADPNRGAYLSLATFRRSGAEIRTPVWFAPDPANPRLLWVYTNGKSGKVKRIRHDGRARVAACDVRGTVHGEWRDVRVRIMAGDTAQEPGFAALLIKYGWQMRALTLLARLGGRWKERTILAIEV